MKLRFSLFLAFGAWSIASSGLVHAQLSRITAERGGIAIGGNVTESTIIIGISLEKVDELVRDRTRSLEELTAQQRDNIALLKEKLDLNERQIAAALHIVGEKDIPQEQLATKLVEIAEQFKTLQASAVAQNGDTPHVTGLKTAAQLAIEAGDLARADSLLAEVSTTQHAAFEEEKRRAVEHLTLISLNEAETNARRAQIALTRLRYVEAAKLFANAAALIPSTSNYDDKRIEYLRKEQAALFKQGSDLGDNGALNSAIELARQIAASLSEQKAPQQWAQAQNSLGIALRFLGERESETAKLEEAAAVLRAALQVETRNRMPLIWATTQNNLGFVLFRLGQREAGTERLEDALVAYREALSVRTREREPLAWATTQNDLGLALWLLGKRGSDTAKFEEAVVAYRSALEVRTRERMPLGWAVTQANLGIVFHERGHHLNDETKLEEAVVTYREAMQEATRERLPLIWAMTQNNLGDALREIGQLTNDAAKLDEAIVAFRLAMQEWTRERTPLKWAMVQHNLGFALSVIGRRTNDVAKLEEAISAYRAALQEFTRERVPLDWASTTGDLGIALVLSAQRRGDLAQAEAAVAQIKTAFEVARDDGGRTDAIYYERQLSWARATVDRMRDK